MTTRRERVVLDVESNAAAMFTRDATAAALLKRELNSLSGTSVETSRTLNRDSGISKMGDDSDTAGKKIDRLSGRLALLAQAAAVLGPALVPIGAVAIPAISGLAAQLGFAAAAGGTAIVAFQGLGDALKAMNKAQLEPTAENLQAAHAAMSNISPAARGFVVELRAMMPALKGVRDAAAGGLFPGLTDSLNDFEKVLPKVEGLFRTLGEATGDMAKNVAGSLASGKWDEFLTFIETNAPQALHELASTIGNLTGGLAEMWMAFDPLNDDFSRWMLSVSASFEQWAAGLSESQGFADFIDYIRTTGPQVAETLGALGSALVDIVTAAAPLGGPVLVAIEGFAKAISAIADSDIGTPLFAGLAAMSLLSRATAGYAAVAKTAFGSSMIGSIRGAASAMVTVTGAAERAQLSVGQLSKRQTALRSGFATIGKSAALMGGLALATSGVADKTGLANTATLGLMGTMLGPWGAAIGVTAGAVMDYAAANDDLKTSLDNVEAAQRSSNTPDFAKRAADAQALSSSIGDLAEKQGIAAETVNRFGSALDFLTGPGDIFNSYQEQMDAAAVKAHDFSVETMGLAEGVSQFFSVASVGDFSKFTTDMSEVQTQATAVYSALTSAGYSVEQINAMLLSHQGWDEAIATAASYVQGADSAAGRADSVASAMADLDNTLVSTASAADTLKNSLDALLSPGLNLSAATDAWNAGLRNLEDSLAKNGRSLVAQTNAADKNREAIRGQVTNLESLLNAQAEAGAGTGKLTRTMERGRTAIINAGVAAGFSRKEMRDYINTLGLTPKMIRTIIDAQTDAAERAVSDLQRKFEKLTGIKWTAKVAAETAQAQAALRAVSATLASLHDKDIHVRIHTDTGMGPQSGYATGGWTGMGPTSEAAGIVHRREVVLPEYVVRRDASHLRSRYGYLPGMSNLPGYATGGLVGSTYARTPETRAANNAADALDKVAEKAHKTRAAFEWVSGGMVAELKVRQKLLEQEIDRDKQRLDMLKQERQALADSIAARFADTPFGQQNGSAPTLADTSGMTPEERAQALATYNQQLDAYQQANSPTAILQQQLADAREMRALLQQLQRMGLSGPALAQVATTASLEEMQALLDSGRGGINQYEHLLGQVGQVSSQIGSSVGNAVYGQDIKEQTKELRESKEQLKHLNERVANLEKSNKQGHHATKAAVDHLAGRVGNSKR